MEKVEYFDYIVNEIHTVIASTVDNQNIPITCAIDIMDYDENGLYFLTAKGKKFYERLKNREYISFTGLKGNDTLSSISITVYGKVKELGKERLITLLEKNKYMNEIYPTDKSKEALTVFQIYSGNGEWFDLSKYPIERANFSFGISEYQESGYFITDKCIGCGKCIFVCPQNCIVIKENNWRIEQEHCLCCGECKKICPYNAVERR